MSVDNYCVCCGECIPEGRLVCPNCENGWTWEEKEEKQMYITAMEARQLMVDSLKEVVKARIEMACKKGEYNTQISLLGTYKQEVVDDIVNTYKELGFTVSVINREKEVVISISWEEV